MMEQISLEYMNFHNFLILVSTITGINYIKHLKNISYDKNIKEDSINDLLIYLHSHRYDHRNKINNNIKSYDW